MGARVEEITVVWEMEYEYVCILIQRKDFLFSIQLLTTLVGSFLGDEVIHVKSESKEKKVNRSKECFF